MLLRPHQQNCINAIDTHLTTENNGVIKMFCGSGKSFVIYHTILKYLENLVIVVVPSINLITQFNRDYLLDDDKIAYNTTHFNKHHEILTICSKNELDEKVTNITTDTNEISNFLTLEQPKIILITYQSFDVLANLMYTNYTTADLICFDEAHHILGENISKLLFTIPVSETDDVDNLDYLDNETFLDRCSNKTLYFTATPRNSSTVKMYQPIIGYDCGEVYYNLVDDQLSICSDEFELNCGQIIYEYTHLDGVRDNILNDFNIRIDLTTKETNENIFKAISRAVLESGNSRVLSFHARSEVAQKGSCVVDFTNANNQKLFRTSFNYVLETEFPHLKDKYTKLTLKGITGATKNKLEILEEFDKSPDNEVYILASCQTIGEGHDSKNANMVVFVDPKQSYVQIIQNIGRICRKNQNTLRLATILIPAYVDVNKYSECVTIEEKDNVIREQMSASGDFNGIFNVLSALRQEDPYIFQLCLQYPDTYTRREISDNLNKNGYTILDKEYSYDELLESYGCGGGENLESVSKKIEKNLQIMGDKILEEDVFVDGGFEDLEIIVKSGDVYNKTLRKGSESGSNKKVDRPNRNIKPFVHSSSEIKVLWEINSELDLDKKVYGGYLRSIVFTESVENWMARLEEVTSVAQ
jgi:predicted helicase